MVVVSALNGELYKVKNGGEKSGLMPERLNEAIEILKQHPALEKVLDVLFALQRINQAVYKIEEAVPEPKKSIDPEAEEAWNSALTKEDSLDDIFAREKKNELAKRMLLQVKLDLIKDFGVDEKSATTRANKFVNTTLKELREEWLKK